MLYDVCHMPEHLLPPSSVFNPSYSAHTHTSQFVPPWEFDPQRPRQYPLAFLHCTYWNMPARVNDPRHHHPVFPDIMQGSTPNPAPVPDGLQGNWQVRELVHHSQTTANFRGRAGEPAPVFAYTPNATEEEMRDVPRPIMVQAPKMSRNLETLLTNSHVTMQTAMSNRQSHRQRRQIPQQQFPQRDMSRPQQGQTRQSGSGPLLSEDFRHYTEPDDHCSLCIQQLQEREDVCRVKCGHCFH